MLYCWDCHISASGDLEQEVCEMWIHYYEIVIHCLSKNINIT